MAERSGSGRTLACILVGLGAFLLVAAILIPTYTLGKLAKTPLDLEVTTVATTEPEGAEVLDAKSLTSPTGSAKVDKNVQFVSQRFITIEEPSDAEKVTLQGGSTLRRTDKQGDTGLLTASIVRGTFDRKTGEPIQDPKGSIQVDAGKPAEEVEIGGLIYRFPFDTQKESYPYYDTNSRETHPIDFVEETEINGMKVYHFSQNVGPTDLSKVVNSPTNKLTLPAEKWGVEGGTAPVTMTRWYTNTRDIWVDPVTGTVIKGGEKPFQYYARSADKPEVTVLKAALVYDENTIESQIEKAKDGADKLSLFGRTIPIIIGILGVILLIVGLFLGFRSGGTPGRRRATGNPPPAPAASNDPQAQPGSSRRDFSSDRTEEIPRPNMTSDQTDVIKRPNLEK